MRRIITAFSRVVAWLLLSTVMMSHAAMAFYVCPELKAPPKAHMMDGMPCAEMDPEQPAHCATEHAGSDLAMHSIASDVPLKSKGIVHIVSFTSPVLHYTSGPPMRGARFALGSDPPYLVTQRLRV